MYRSDDRLGVGFCKYWDDFWFAIRTKLDAVDRAVVTL